MLSAYLVRPLSADQIAQALPLVQLLDPALTLERWHDYARPAFRGAPQREKREIITIQDAKGYIHGLAFCRSRMDLRDGRVFEVENFISLDWSGGRRVALALLDALEARARAWNCDRIRVRPPDPQPSQPPSVAHGPVFGLLRKAGFSSEPTYMSKTLVSRPRLIGGTQASPAAKSRSRSASRSSTR